MQQGADTTAVIFDTQTHSLQCSCPTFVGNGNGCLHVELLRLWRAAQPDNGQRNAEQPKVQPKPLLPVTAAPAPEQPTAAHNPTGRPTLPQEIAELANHTVIPWGKFKGKSLQQLAATSEGQSYLFFLARKSEAKQEADQALKVAAEQVMVALVERLTQSAQRAPDHAMPVLPFGDDKGKLLHQAHPKWVTILAKKEAADARSFQDLVLYAVAKTLQVQRGPTFGRRSNGLSDEQFTQLLAELRGIRTAIEQIAHTA